MKAWPIIKVILGITVVVSVLGLSAGMPPRTALVFVLSMLAYCAHLSSPDWTSNVKVMGIAVFGTAIVFVVTAALTTIGIVQWVL